MPLYDYDCAACGRRFEVIHGVDADGPDACPLCGSGPVRKAFSAPAVHFKGSGWAKKDRRPSPSSAKRSTGEGSDASPTPATDASPEKPSGGTTAESKGAGSESTKATTAASSD